LSQIFTIFQEHSTPKRALKFSLIQIPFDEQQIKRLMIVRQNINVPNFNSPLPIPLIKYIGTTQWQTQPCKYGRAKLKEKKNWKGKPKKVKKIKDKILFYFIYFSIFFFFEKNSEGWGGQSPP